MRNAPVLAPVFTALRRGKKCGVHHNLFHAPPHPGHKIGYVPHDPHPACGHLLPFPRAKDIFPQLPLAESGELSAVALKIRATGFGRTAIRKTKTDRQFFLLPGGGQDEGGRQTIFIAPEPGPVSRA